MINPEATKSYVEPVVAELNDKEIEEVFKTLYVNIMRNVGFKPENETWPSGVEETLRNGGDCDSRALVLISAFRELYDEAKRRNIALPSPFSVGIYRGHLHINEKNTDHVMAGVKLKEFKYAFETGIKKEAEQDNYEQALKFYSEIADNPPKVFALRRFILEREFWF